MAKSKLVKLKTDKMTIDYDEKTDVLYITFNPEKADDSELTENDIIIRYKNNKIIGLTILHFSERKNNNNPPTNPKPSQTTTKTHKQ